MWNTVNIITFCKPKYIIWENVKNLLSKKHKHNFDSYISILDSLGYNSYYQVLNAKDYGIPQNRERVYTVSIRKDIDKGSFTFPEKEELKLRLKDILENEVDEKYYLSEKAIEGLKRQEKLKHKPNFIENKEIVNTIDTKVGDGTHFSPYLRENKCIQVGKLDIKGHDSIKRVYSDEGLSPTLTDMQGGNRQPKIMIKKNTKKGYLEATDGDSVNLSFPTSNSRRGRVGKEVSQTLQCNDLMGVVVKDKINVIGNYSPSNHDASRIVDSNGIAPTIKENHGTVTATNQNLRIRKLTPKECWRLMNFTDEDFEKAANVPTSNTQLYKQAGNSICVNVLEKIFKNLFI